MWKAETPESINPQSPSYSQSSGELMNGRIFVFDWINVSQLKHLPGPECIVMVSVDCVMTRSCLIQDRSPAPIIRLLMTLIIPLSRSRHPVQCGHTPGPHGQSQGHRASSNDQCQHPQCQTQCHMLSNAFWVMDCPWESKFVWYVCLRRCKTITNKEVFDVKWLRPCCVCLAPARVNIAVVSEAGSARANDWGWSPGHANIGDQRLIHWPLSQ